VSGKYVLGSPEGDALDAIDGLHAHLRDGLLELLLALRGLVVLVVSRLVVLAVFVVVFGVLVLVVVVAVLVVLVFGFSGHDMQSLQY